MPRVFPLGSAASTSPDSLHSGSLGARRAGAQLRRAMRWRADHPRWASPCAIPPSRPPPSRLALRAGSRWRALVRTRLGSASTARSAVSTARAPPMAPSPLSHQRGPRPHRGARVSSPINGPASSLGRPSDVLVGGGAGEAAGQPPLPGDDVASWAGFQATRDPPGPSAGWGSARRRHLAARASRARPPPGRWVPLFLAGCCRRLHLNRRDPPFPEDPFGASLGGPPSVPP